MAYVGFALLVFLAVLVAIWIVPPTGKFALEG